jgi:hypothetical protein
MFKGLELWNKVEVTDAKMTKPFDRGNFKGTAVDALHNIKRLTEILGPVGQNWGWTVISDRLDTFGTDQNAQTIHSLTLRAWFLQSDGSIREFDHIGHTKAAYWTRGSPGRYMVDEEYGKKSLTDALSKVMVCMGVSADVWLGRFDGNKYYEPPAANEDGPEAKPAPKLAAVLAKDPRTLIAEAGVLLADVKVTDDKGLRAAREWLRQSPDGKQPSHWLQLAQADRDLRDELAGAMSRRAEELGISLKESA